MNQSLSPFLVLRALIPNTLQWQGPTPGGGAAAPGTTGNNYIFTATQLLIKNVETDRYYVLEVTWPAGVEGLKFETEVVAPTPAGAIPDTGDNYEFTADGYLRFKHETEATFHTLTVWNGLQEVVGPGNASNPGTFAQAGLNYRFIGGNLQFLDEFAGGGYRTVYLVGPDGAQMLEIETI